MQLSNWMIIGAIEAYGLLLVICVFLLFRTRGLQGLIGRLQDKIQSLVEDLAEAKEAAKQPPKATSEDSQYVQLLEEQIDFTREHHQELDPEHDISLDLAEDAPLPRKIASLRHAMLIAEKEASLSGANHRPNWDVIQSKFGNLMQFFGVPVTPAGNLEINTAGVTVIEPDVNAVEGLQEALNESYQRIENLEQFKDLFFEMEEEWAKAKEQAEDYFQQLQNIELPEDQQPLFENLINSYRKSYDAIDLQFAKQKSQVEQAATTANTNNKASNAEVDRLRQVAANQHHLINELQKKLAGANTDSERVQLITELQQQLDQQTRFVQESETCIQLMDSELNTANERIDELEKQLDKAGQAPTAPRIKELETIVDQRVKKELALNKRIEQLEQENEQLAMQFMSVSSDTGNNETQAKLKKLQKQYLALEEKYLALRSKR